ncbi:uncharacterized protein LOC131149724 [Malania oleifera]|uniref:uncharacterized protein LOC131149724 n=1 Tax=Malania oleifera TaxID=397392 RepID=UPI0025AE2876|nr:uncharacterized protein LOC131149724 [Malania oleifera]
MAVDGGIFETLTPSRYITFTFPSPTLSPPSHQNHHPNLLRVAVLDSPLPPADAPRVAAMLVPERRETDWIFSTESGHLQLLLNFPGISRLILVGDVPECDFPASYNPPVRIDSKHRARLEECLKPLLIALSPKSLMKHGVPEIPFLVYEDTVIRSIPVERCVGPCVGEMLVEDVEIECLRSERELRRRLRFKRMPNLVQTEIRIVSDSCRDLDCLGIGEGEFQLDTGALVHSYLAPMVASLSLIGNRIDECGRSGVRPRALCVGVGGGALLTFLHVQLGFEVVGVEADEVVLRVARQYFGLGSGEFIRVFVGDGIEFLEKISNQNMQNMNSSDSGRGKNVCIFENMDGLATKYDVILVDLDSNDVRNGISAPPLEFIRKPVLLAAKMILHKLGIIVINVIPPSKSYYEMLIRQFQAVFQEIYEIDVGNGENFVLIATGSLIETSSCRSENSFLSKLKSVILGQFMDSIRKL